MKQPQLLCVVLPGGENQVMSSQTKSPLHGGHERAVEDNPVHSRGLYQLRKLHDLSRQTRTRQRQVVKTGTGFNGTGFLSLLKHLSNAFIENTLQVDFNINSRNSSSAG